MRHGSDKLEQYKAVRWNSSASYAGDLLYTVGRESGLYRERELHNFYPLSRKGPRRITIITTNWNLIRSVRAATLDTHRKKKVRRTEYIPPDQVNLDLFHLH